MVFQDIFQNAVVITDILLYLQKWLRIFQKSISDKFFESLFQSNIFSELCE